MSLLEKLQRELAEAQARLKAAQEYPDLEEITDRWGIVRLVTDTVKEKAIQFEVRPECECCSGAKVYALPYIEFEGVRLYSKIPAISFAKRYKANNIHIYLAHDDWDESEEWEAFNGLLVDKVAEWLDDHDADPYDDDDDDDWDDDEDEVEALEGIEDDSE